MLGLTHTAYADFLRAQYGEEAVGRVLQAAGLAADELYASGCPYADDVLLDRVIGTASTVLGVDQDSLNLQFGRSFVAQMDGSGYGKLLRSMGATFVDCMRCLNSLHTFLSVGMPALAAPEFLVQDVTSTSLTLHYYSSRPGLHAWVQGMLDELARSVFGLQIGVELLLGRHLGNSEHEVYRINFPAVTPARSHVQLQLQARDSVMGLNPETLYRLFPFHFVMDLDLCVIQAGSALRTLVPELATPGQKVTDVLQILHPHGSWDLDRLLLHKWASKLVLSTRSGLELTGGLYRAPQVQRDAAGKLQEGGDVVLFLGCPRIASLDDLTRQNLYLLDLSTHDLCAEYILMSEQHQAVKALKEECEAKVAALEQELSMQEDERWLTAQENEMLKETLAKTLECQESGMPPAATHAPADLAVKLLDRLIMGEQVEVEQLLQARNALLTSGPHPWHPPTLVSSNIGQLLDNKDDEVVRALEQLLVHSHHHRHSHHQDDCSWAWSNPRDGCTSHEFDDLTATSSQHTTPLTSSQHTTITTLSPSTNLMSSLGSSGRAALLTGQYGQYGQYGHGGSVAGGANKPPGHSASMDVASTSVGDARQALPDLVGHSSVEPSGSISVGWSAGGLAGTDASVSGRHRPPSDSPDVSTATVLTGQQQRNQAWPPTEGSIQSSWMHLSTVSDAAPCAVNAVLQLAEAGGSGAGRSAGARSPAAGDKAMAPAAAGREGAGGGAVTVTPTASGGSKKGFLQRITQRDGGVGGGNGGALSLPQVGRSTAGSSGSGASGNAKKQPKPFMAKLRSLVRRASHSIYSPSKSGGGKSSGGGGGKPALMDAQAITDHITAGAGGAGGTRSAPLPAAPVGTAAQRRSSTSLLHPVPQQSSLSPGGASYRRSVDVPGGRPPPGAFMPSPFLVAGAARTASLEQALVARMSAAALEGTPPMAVGAASPPHDRRLERTAAGAAGAGTFQQSGDSMADRIARAQSVTAGASHYLRRAAAVAAQQLQQAQQAQGHVPGQVPGDAAAGAAGATATPPCLLQSEGRSLGSLRLGKRSLGLLLSSSRDGSPRAEGTQGSYYAHLQPSLRHGSCSPQCARGVGEGPGGTPAALMRSAGNLTSYTLHGPNAVGGFGGLGSFSVSPSLAQETSSLGTLDRVAEALDVPPRAGAVQAVGTAAAAGRKQQGALAASLAAAAAAGAGAGAAAADGGVQAQGVQLLKLMESPPELLTHALRRVDSWQYDSFELERASNGRPLSCLGFYLIKTAGLVKRFNLHEGKLARYLMRVEDGYPDNPYHNRVHGADVLRSMHMLLTQGGVLNSVVSRAQQQQQPLRLGASAAPAANTEPDCRDKVESAFKSRLLACYLAAIVHDYEHRGVNNDFLIRSSDPLALLYNDHSPMENHHVAAAFLLLRDKAFAFMPEGNRKTQDLLRKDVIELVLCTDMKQHFSLTGIFSCKVAAPASSSGTSGGSSSNLVRKSSERIRTSNSLLLRTSNSRPRGPIRSNNQVVLHETLPEGEAAAAPRLSPEPGTAAAAAATASVADPAWDDETQMLVLKMALKCADLSHLTSTVEVHKQWVTRLEEEMFRQGDRERAAGLPVSALMDRRKEGVTRSQSGFFNIVAIPMYKALSQTFPATAPMLENALANLSVWKEKEAAV